MKVCVSQSPARQSDVSRKWFKSIKNTSVVGGKILFNAYGGTKEEAEASAKNAVAAIIKYDSNSKITVDDIELKVMEIFGRVEVKKDVRHCVNYILSLIH